MAFSFEEKFPGATGTLQYAPGSAPGPGGSGGAAATSPGSGWEVRVLSYADFSTVLALIPSQMINSFQFVKQLNDLGSGTVTLNMDDPWWQTATLADGTAPFEILDFECLWQVTHDGVPRMEFLGETVQEQLVDPSEQRIVSITGPGSIAALKWAMAAPLGFPDIVLKLDAISDAFSEVDVNGNPVLDTNIWNTISPAGKVYITPVQPLFTQPGGAHGPNQLFPSGTLTIQATSGTTVLGATPYDAADTLISAQITPIGAASIPTDSNGNAQAYGTGLNGTELTQFYVQSLVNTGYYAMIGLSATSFYCQEKGPDGTRTHVIASASAFDPSNDAYWMITEQAGSGGGPGTFFFWTAPDGQNWTLQWQTVHTWNASDCGFYVAATYSAAGQSVILSNLNGNVTTPSYQGNIYLDTPAMGIWHDLLLTAQARGTTGFVTTSLTDTGDSFGRPWTDSQNVQVTNGTDLYSLLQSFCATVNADYVMQPGFLLQVGQTAQSAVSLGADRTSSIVFREGKDQSSKQRTRARTTIVNMIGGENSDGHEISSTDTVSAAQWGQREGWFQASAQVDPVSLEIAVAAAAADQADEQLSWTLTIPPGLPGKQPFTHFDVGDWVGLERPDFSAVDSVRVVGIAVAVDSTGLETYELTVSSYLQWLEQQLTYISNKLGGAFVNALGTTPVAPSTFGTGQVPTYFTPAQGLGTLANVVGTAGHNAAPLVYNAATGMWQPAGTAAPGGGQVGVTIPSDSGTVIIGGGQVTHSASPTPVVGPDGGGTPGPSASTTTGPAGTTIVDGSGNTRVITGVQSDGTVTVTEQNGSAPAVPDSPSVAVGISALTVGWDGLLAGSAPLFDFLWTEVHVSTTTGFTPSSATLKATMTAGGIAVVSNLTAGTTYYVKLLARNRSRVASGATTQVSGVPINAAQAIPNGSITAAQLSFTAGGVTVTIGSAPGSPSTGDLWYDSANGYRLNQWSGSAWVPFQFGTNAIAAGSITAALIAANTITAAQIASGTITATQITSATITGTQIAANTITAAELVSGIIVAGIINGTVVTGSTLQNSGSNPRTSINPDGSITVTNSGGTVIFEVGPDGTMYWFTGTGALQMELQPGGTTLIYNSATGPTSWDFEPIGTPLEIAEASSAASSSTVTATITQASPAGSQVMVWAASSGTDNATGVTDTQGNTYSQDSTVTTNMHMQAFVCNNANALGTSDTITVTFSATNTQTKLVLAATTPNLATSGTHDVTANANGSSTTPAVSLTPTVPGDVIFAVIADATAGGTPTMPDGWTQIGQAGTGPFLTSWYTTTANTAALSPSATIVSAAWAMTLSAWKQPGASTSQNWVAVRSTIPETTAWSNTGLYGLKVMSNGTGSSGSPWGATSPAFPVVPGGVVSMQVMVNTPSALSAVSIGFTFWSLPNGGGSNLGSVSGDQGTLGLGAGQQNLLTITGATVPGTAQSATFFVQEAASDSSGIFFDIDTVQVAGGLVYSLSPVATTDPFGNDVPQGLQFTGLAGLTNVLGVQDYLGNTLAQIDGQGNIAGQLISASSDVLIGGASVEDLINALPAGLVNRGWTPTNTANTTPWPSTAIGGTDVAILELDQTLKAGRAYKVTVLPAPFLASTADTQYVQNLRATTDGSTPSTSTSALSGNHITTTSTANKNYMTPYQDFIVPNLTSDTLYRFLVTAHIQAGTFQYEDYLELRIEDLGLWNGLVSANNGSAIGAGAGGASGPGSFTKSYRATASHSYYGATGTYGSGHFGKRTDNSSCYQSCQATPSHAFLEGDQYSFAVFNHSAIASDLSGATITSVKLTLNCLSSYYSTGMTVILGWTNFSGTFGDPFIPGGGSHENVTTFHIGKGQTLTKDITASGIGTQFQSGGATALMFGPASSSTGFTDQNNDGFLFGYSASDSRAPTLTFNFTK